jgi:uncharacterized damage-inducible protein DinB
MTSIRQGRTEPRPSPEVQVLLQILEDSFGRKAWHGPNLRGSVRRVTAEQAVWRPKPGRHSIAEIIVHCTYWKYAVRRRLRADARGSFAIKGSNWFAVPSPLTEAQWKQSILLLEDEHRALIETVAAFPAERLAEFPRGGKVPYLTLIYGVASHDVYHAGQIQVLKRLQAPEA